MFETTQVAIYILLLCGLVCGIAALMEIYKKVIRKDKASKVENLLVGLGLSAIAASLLYFSKVIIPVLGIIGAPLWLDFLLYAFGIFVIQMNVDMLVIKKIVKSLVTNLLKKANFTDEQIEDIFNAVNAQ